MEVNAVIMPKELLNEEIDGAPITAASQKKQDEIDDFVDEYFAKTRTKLTNLKENFINGTKRSECHNT